MSSATPLSAGSLASNSVSASSPPAEAPTPTIGKILASAWGSNLSFMVAT